MTRFETALRARNEVGTVREIRLPLAWVEGLPSARVHEVVTFESGVQGLVSALTRDAVEVLLLSAEGVAIGEQAAIGGEKLNVMVGPHLAGATITPLGEVVGAGAGVAGGQKREMIDVRPRPIEARRKIRHPLYTGASIVDLLLPLGRGQRQLVIGDSKTGKGSLAQTLMQTQASLGTMVVYAAIGKRWSDVAQLQKFVQERVAYKNVVLVVSWAHDPASLVWLTPFCAMAVAEWWVEMGHEALVIFDDLSAHAQVHREIALLGRRFPGRESYPGDMFYTHARLLERAGNFAAADGKGDVALSCLPIAETVEGSITSHVISNLISITDGHLLLDPTLFREGLNPPAEVGLSVTRVGRQTQTKLAKQLHRELTSMLTAYAQARQLSHFGAELSTETQEALARGERLYAFLTQPTGTHGVSLPYPVQLVFAAMVWLDWMEEAPGTVIAERRDAMLARYEAEGSVRSQIDELAASATLQELTERMEIRRDRLLALCQASTETTKAI